MHNRVKARWASGQVAYGGWCTLGSPFSAELIAHAGFDFIGLDAQHGLFGYESLLHSLMAVGSSDCSPIVRLPSSDAAIAGKTLDAGAHGIIFPMIESADDARSAVDACRIYPAGHRSFGPLRASQTFGRVPGDLNEGVVCLVMIETVRGVENAAEIATVDGVDGIYVGPGDLAVTLGLPPTLQPIPGPHADAIEHVRDVALAHEVALGIPCASAETALALAAEGYSFIAVGGDAWWITAAAKAAVEKINISR